ncbi:MAG: RdgB/HAM1 family non-canonical purine NTP pyrophosphatase [Brevibacterium sp.]|uniref:RdgB/HAM1 family non-canonical purine NTP pyrophosphatase n=1 Tax=Brevibacterium sp. TaxID=1701 RepID=UPI0026476A7A|nr:RdgB/HAM1 family non-canonical purine NTP pyrophosphatase [Brevibacterium sp.]MDN5805750.1 RdgB/HAM1 family non-canonical purine NTP pyrophosphatase [Brevibacterium sp.]MDN5834182.1 RdgB/HAM1 family non-canonical purine NTP pyrophosphatase [Brevibacterium sp.]MDN5876178.1 RdgB/HAM1 family non-canonical purine NTP pyrophosphatase [Brevibacterium sp.]MDN5909215.1 RdgB/HAM1 family non-canonical purine NTP pyrophosphatase [Brevibacterium sp.]MDN6133580.1 RdgB/HAM1 family non-canonical purine NT
MTTFVLATHNEGKRRELAAILLPALGEGIHVMTAAEAGLGDIPETGVTFAENALIKARAAAQATGHTSIADDSGITVDVLGGAPGIFSARWAGRHGDDRANLELLLAQLSDISSEHRGAQFRCAAAAVTPDGREFSAEGVMAGRLAASPSGEHGFGYDPIFIPDGGDISAAQMTPEEKNSRSHRKVAFDKLAAVLAAQAGL